MWSVGCVMGEMFAQHPIFQADLDIHMLGVIEDTCGSFNKDIWPGITEQTGINCRRGAPRKLKNRFTKHMDRWTKADRDQALDLLDKLLLWDPAQRITATDALKHPWFTTSPLARIP